MASAPRVDDEPTPAARLLVPMSDGAHVEALLYPTTASGRAPVVVAMTPYRKDQFATSAVARTITDAGCHFVIADVRGTGGSVAQYEGLLSDREITDYVELIEWARTLPASDGSVATVGGSYLGINSLLAAARRPAGLRCAVVSVPPVDTYRDWIHRGGIPSHVLWGAAAYIVSQQAGTRRRGPAEYAELLANDFDNEGHRRRSPEGLLARIAVPVLVVGGWHDFFLRGTIRAFNGVAGPKRLVIGPWGHGDRPPELLTETASWFSRWLHADGDETTRPAPVWPASGVRLYRTGAGARVERESWRRPDEIDFEELPLVTGPTEVRVGTHLAGIPPAENPKPSFSWDPTGSGMSTWGEQTVFDVAAVDDDLDVEGPVCLHLSLAVATGCTDIDVHARLSVVADGHAEQLVEGRLRAGHRRVDVARSDLDRSGRVVVPWHTHDRDQPLEGDLVDLVIPMDALCHRFRSGETIRLGLTLVRADELSSPTVATVDAASVLLLPRAP